MMPDRTLQRIRRLMVGGKISLKRASFRLLTLNSRQPLALTRLSSGLTWPTIQQPRGRTLGEYPGDIKGTP